MRGSADREVIDHCFRRLLDELGTDVGRLAARILVEQCGGLSVHFPTMRTLNNEACRRTIIQAYRDGYTSEQLKGLAAELAAKYGLKVRGIRRMVLALNGNHCSIKMRKNA